jgi:hypothetical protein
MVSFFSVYMLSAENKNIMFTKILQYRKILLFILFFSSGFLEVYLSTIVAM